MLYIECWFKVHESCFRTDGFVGRWSYTFNLFAKDGSWNNHL